MHNSLLDTHLCVYPYGWLNLVDTVMLVQCQSLRSIFKFTVPFTCCKSVDRDRLKRTHSSKCKQTGNFHACSRVQCGIFKTKQTMPWNKWDPYNHKSARNGPDVQDFTLNHIKWLPLPSSASYNKSWNDYKVKEKCTFQIMPQNRTERPYTGFYFAAVRNRWQPDMTSE